MTSAQPAQQGSRLGTGLKIALAVFTGLLLVLVLAILLRIPIAEHLIANALRAQGLRDVSLSVVRLDATGLVIENLEAENGALNLNRLDIAFSPTGLLQRHIDAFALSGAHAALVWDDNGLRLGSWNVALQDNGSSTPPSFTRFTAQDLSLELTTPSAVLTATTALSIENTRAGWDTLLTGRLAGPGTQAEIDWQGVISPSDLTQWAGEGTVQASVRDLPLPNIVDRFSATGSAAIVARDGTFTFAIREPVVLQFSPLAPSLIDAFPFLEGLRETPSYFRAAPAGEVPTLQVTARDTSRQARLDVALFAEAGAGRADIALSGGATQSDGAPAVFDLETGRIAVTAFPLGKGAVSGHFAVTNVEGTTESAQGRVDLLLDLKNQSIAGMTLGRLQAATAGPFTFTDTRAVFDMQSFKTIVSDSSFGTWTTAVPIVLGLANLPKSQQRLDIGWGAGATGLQLDTTVALSETTFRDTTKEEQVPLRIAAPHVHLNGAIGLTTRSLAVGLRNLSLDHEMAALRDGRADIKVEGDALSGQIDTRLARLGPASDDSGTTQNPLHLSATLSSQRTSYALRGTLASAAGDRFGSFAVTTQQDFTQGEATLEIPRATFAHAGGLDPALLNFVAPLSDLTGTIGLSVKSTWPTRTASAQIVLDDVSFALNDVSIAGLDATLTFDSLFPLKTPAPQHVTADAITAGLPVSDLTATFTLPGDGKTHLSAASVGIAGGKISVGDITFSPGEVTTLPVQIEKIDMAQLAQLASVDGLSVSGTLSGPVPLVVSESQDLSFAGGMVRADAPGRVMYKPSTPPAALSQSQGGGLLLQALSNFAYDRLTIALDGPVMDDITMTVGLAGNNPDLYGGYPIEFNLNLEGKLTQILKQGFTGYKMPVEIERQIRNREKSGP